jgi:hypothetical protein
MPCPWSSSQLVPYTYFYQQPHASSPDDPSSNVVHPTCTTVIAHRPQCLDIIANLKEENTWFSSPSLLTSRRIMSFTAHHSILRLPEESSLFFFTLFGTTESNNPSSLPKNGFPWVFLRQVSIWLQGTRRGGKWRCTKKSLSSGNSKLLFVRNHIVFGRLRPWHTISSFSCW